jgi:hypothetical protein
MKSYISIYALAVFEAQFQHYLCLSSRGSETILIINLFRLPAALTSKLFEAAAYRHYSYTGAQNNNPVFGSSPVAASSRPESRPSRASDLGLNENLSWNPHLFYQSRPAIHGPQMGINENNFRPQGQRQTLGAAGNGFARQSPQNSFARRPQLGNNDNNRPNLFLPPGADDPDDIFIFDRPTSPRPRPPLTISSTSTTTTTIVADCDCPSTQEFNPVCGSDGITYTNPGKLKCAIFCGTGNLLFLEMSLS